MLFNTLNSTALALSAGNLERLWQTPLLGMAMIFAVLSLLWAVLAVFKFIFAKPTKARKPERVAEEAPAVVEVVEEPVADEPDDGELVAVITAAVAAYMASEAPDATTGGFRVVSFRRVNGGKSWNTK